MCNAIMVDVLITTVQRISQRLNLFIISLHMKAYDDRNFNERRE